MDPFTTPGAFSWAELMTTDPAAAATFYGELFGWKIETMEMGMGPYRVVKVGDASVAGIMAPDPSGPPMPNCWASYVTVTDTDATVAKCTSLGGKLLVPPMDIPGVGRMAVIQDPQGAVLNVMAYSPRQN